MNRFPTLSLRIGRQPMIWPQIRLGLCLMLGLAICPASSARLVMGDEPTAAESAAESVDPADDVVRAKGAAIYAVHCIQCHGGEGQGNEDYYPDPLIGDSTIGELADLISDTMPEADPDACVAKDAMAVASYIHHEFYSEAAQVRRRPPRAALARLTAEQLRQSLADLYGSFHGPPWNESGRGISALYFDAGQWKKDKLKIERDDPVLNFDFGHDGPGEGITPTEYYINWSGSLLVEQSGIYEIIMRSSCAFTLDFGHNDRELINNHVQSEGKAEFRRTLYLVGGRCYPLGIDFHQRKRKTEQPAAYVELAWVPPGGVEEVIPHKNLLPSQFPPVFALQAKLPPDDRSYGYQRGTAVNRAWDESTTAAAIEFAQAAISELYPRYRGQHKKDADDDRQILRSFLTDLVSIAFRKPLDDAMKSHYVDRLVDRMPDDGDAIKLVCLYALKSPRFLYPTLDADRSAGNRAANRLAMVMFDSLPSDAWLRKMAEKNQLDKPNKVVESAWRLVGDYRCRAKTKAFLYHWFHLDDIDEITKDQSLHPGFDKPLVSDLRDSVDKFFDEVVYSDTSDFRQLLQADWAFTNSNLTGFYGEAWKPADGAAENDQSDSLVKSVADPVEHVGLLTHPLLTTKLAYHRTTSPIHRGVFLTRHVLGRVLRPPNAAFSPINPDLHPGLTTRQRVELQTGEVSCQVCHSKINAVGFALENFDAAGRYRKLENEKPIDASGSYINRQGETFQFEGARELGDFLAGSRDCHRSFVESAFEHFVKQPIAAYGPELSDQLTQRFQESGFNVQQLIVSIAEISVLSFDQPQLASAVSGE